MFAQIGSIQFKGLLGFQSFETTDNTTYAQYDLINAKPILRPTGNDIEEHDISIRLHASFCNVEASIRSLKNSKDSYEILPLLLGNGSYVGDFVITEMSISRTQAFADGTVTDATVSLKLREYASSDKLQQQQNSDRKKAFALGTKKPVTVPALQAPSVPQLAANDLGLVNSVSAALDNNVRAYENNVSSRQTIADKIQSSLKKIDANIAAFNNRLDSISNLLVNVAVIKDAVAAVRSVVTNFQFPITSIDDLKINNRNLQQAVRNVNIDSTQLINLVITRAA